MRLPRLLIDENLSVTLPPIAHARGFECAHVVHMGLAGATDWRLLDVVAADDWVLVTNNAIEFRGRYRQLELHPGVVFLVPSAPRAQQIELFEAALADITARPDLLNTALDVTFEAGRARARRYPLP